MGVKGLLPCLRSITRPVALERYRGLTVAVDAMSWLHKGVFAGDVRTLAKHQWNERLATGQTNTGGANDSTTCRPTSRRLDFEAHAERYQSSSAARESSRAALAAASKCIAYAMRHAETLRRDYGMDVVMVIDGGALPSKSEIDQGRREERRQAFEDAMAAEAKGDSRNARKLYARACSVTHQMRHELILSCRRAGIHFVVAPYEADAQMAQLAHSGAVDLVITEDSDLLAYGCPRVLFKIDLAAGRGEEIQLMRDLAANDDPSFRNWTHDMFVYMCIVNGCDYCEGIPGIGIKTAHKLVRMHRTPSKIFKALRMAGRMPKDFEDSFYRAYRTFRHQRVYNQAREQVEPLLPIDETRVDGDTRTIWPFLGPFIDPERAKAIATGVLHPIKKVPWDVALADESNVINEVRSDTTRRQDFRPESRHLDDNRNYSPGDHHRRPQVGRKKTDRDNMFKFFPSKTKGKGGEDARCSPSPSHSRPPLQEIIVNGDRRSDKEPTCNVNGGIAADRGRPQPIPLHFNEYSSSLVGNTFETLSRRSRAPSAGSRNVSLAVQRLRESARARIKAHHEAKDSGGQKEGGAERLVPNAAVKATAGRPSSNLDGRQDDQLAGDAYTHDETNALYERPRSNDAMTTTSANLFIENHAYHEDEIARRHNVEQWKEGRDTEHDYDLNQSVDMYSDEQREYSSERNDDHCSGADYPSSSVDLDRCDGVDLHYRYHQESQRDAAADTTFDNAAYDETSDLLEQPDEREFRRNNPVDMSLELFDSHAREDILSTSRGLQAEELLGRSGPGDANNAGQDTAVAAEPFLFDGGFESSAYAGMKVGENPCFDSNETCDVEPTDLDTREVSPKDVVQFCPEEAVQHGYDKLFRSSMANERGYENFATCASRDSGLLYYGYGNDANSFLE